MWGYVMPARTTPKDRYQQHKRSSKIRGIEFTLTFEQWWGLWEPHWERRGQKSQDMCMCRKGDKGGYTWGNVRIATVKENQHERALEYRTTHAQRRSIYTTAHPLKHFGAASVEWARGRNAFAEYSEDEEDFA